MEILDAIHMLTQAWSEVKMTTASNCFKKAFTVQEDESQKVDVLADVVVSPNKGRKEFET